MKKDEITIEVLYQKIFQKEKEIVELLVVCNELQMKVKELEEKLNENK